MRLLLSLVCAFGCTASGDAVTPPGDQFFFPTGIAVSPDESTLFVTNANSELRYNGGTIIALDLDRVDDVLAGWAAGSAADGCTSDPEQRETLVCDEAGFVKLESTRRMGDFATNIAVQDRGDGRARLFIPTRGDPSITWIDWDGTALSCSSSAESLAVCDDAHRLVDVHDDPDVGSIPEEPFDVFADSTEEFAVVTHFTTGAVTLIDSPAAGDAMIADIVSGQFSSNANGYIGASGVAGRMRGEHDVVYVGSQYENRIQTFTVAQPVNNAPRYLLAGAYFFLDAGLNAGSSSDTRGLAFNEDATRLYVLNRYPPSVQVIDTSELSTGAAANRLIGVSDVCRVAEKLVVVDSGDGDRLLVTCFQDGQLYVVDPRGASSVEDVISVGRGPYGLAVSRTRQRAYITNVLEDTVAVIDTRADSSTRNRVVLRIGLVRPPE